MSMFERISQFDGTRDSLRPTQRVDNVREAARDFRRTMLARPRVRFYKTFELVRVPYPSKYAYLNAYSAPTPFVHLCNRLFVIQFDSSEGLKTLLVSPSDWENQRETPFFAQLDAMAGRLSGVMEKLVVKATSTVLDCLASIGLRPEDVDYLTYDHLHTQNVTRWLGGAGHRAIFPNAKLLVMREEWESTQALIPWQNQWYCPGGIASVPAARVELLDDGVFLGDGSVALMRTKGHTEGNHSIVAHTDQGLLVTSENGVSLDAYAPQHSKIPGLAAFAKQTGAEIVINGNTLEYAVDQYISMVQEKCVAGPWPQDERFPNMALSSESDGYWLFPRTAPTARMGDLEFGRFTQPKAR
jgi:glyoxylase-like metal-dependent hydrolase (beta-lactamase superfamily II)